MIVLSARSLQLPESKIVPSRYSLSPHSGVLGRSFELRFTYTMFPLQSHNKREKSESVSCLVMSDSLQPHGLLSPPGSSIHGISQARTLEWVPFSRVFS